MSKGLIYIVYGKKVMEIRPKAFLGMTGRIGKKGQKQGYRICNANHYYCCDLHCKEHCNQIHNVEYYEAKEIGTINTCQSYLIIIQNIYGLLKGYMVPLPLLEKSPLQNFGVHVHTCSR